LKLDDNLLLVLKSSGIGEGAHDLAETLLKAFLTTLSKSGTAPARIICLNSAVFLTTEGSSVVDIISTFAEQGTEVLSCATCLEYYDRQNKLLVGKSTNMKATVEAMLGFEKVLSP
jgi:selenium metabolism protein YedF